MSLGNFTINFLQQMDNPECSYLMGITIGQFLTFRIIAYLFFMLIVYNMVDKLGIQPLLDYLKKIIYKRRK